MILDPETKEELQEIFFGAALVVVAIFLTGMGMLCIYKIFEWCL